jgi:hypothetical protein
MKVPCVYLLQLTFSACGVSFLRDFDIDPFSLCDPIWIPSFAVLSEIGKTQDPSETGGQWCRDPATSSYFLFETCVI